MIFDYPIAIGLSPNTQSQDVWQAVKILCQPWIWKRGKQLGEIKEWFKQYFAVNDVFLFNSGRSALYVILQAFGIGKGDEVIIQAFTCVAVPDPIIWVGAKAVYADIDDSLNIDHRRLERLITPHTKAIIVQHTFGIPADTEKIKKITQKYKIKLIEDCSHSIGSSYKSNKIGSFGDAAFFSFGRDKVISSVFGGAAILRSDIKDQISKIKNIEEDLDFPSNFWILQQFFHPIAFSIILPLYNITLGKIILYLLLKLKLLSKPVYDEEKRGILPTIFPKKYPNALASLLVKQLLKLDQMNKRRREIADFYFKNLTNDKKIQLPDDKPGAIYLRFNVLTESAEEILSEAKKRKIILGNWYKSIIDPKGVDFQKIGYIKGNCPKAEEAAKLSLNLPTYPRLTTDQLKRIIELFHEDTGN